MEFVLIVSWLALLIISYKGSVFALEKSGLL